MAYNFSPYGNTLPAQSAIPSHSRRASRSSITQSIHPYRVEKPWSNHNSPMVLERRKTTTGAKLYATLDDHYRMMMGIVDDSDEMVRDSFQPASVRPVSWHPTSSHANYASQQQEHMQSQNWTGHYSSSSGGNSTSGSDFYSLSARNSTLLETAQDPSPYMTVSEARLGHKDSNTSHPPQLNAQPSGSVPTAESMPWYLQEWARRNQEQAKSALHGSVDFLPIQYPSSEQDTDHIPREEVADDPSKELIGMGLYDLPDTVTGLGSLVEATGKGLKLEETWQPPEENDGDQEEDESSDDCEEELPPPPAVVKQEPQHLPVSGSVKPHLASSMAGQSFLFDEDDLASKEWWYHQFKQPTMPVRETGVGYSWI